MVLFSVMDIADILAGQVLCLLEEEHPHLHQLLEKHLDDLIDQYWKTFGSGPEGGDSFMGRMSIHSLITLLLMIIENICSS